jgi:dTDP-glucose 4,6-dehydratase
MENPLAEDLDHILEHTTGLWEELRGQNLFITGGTGFFGCWLLESFAWANDRLRLGALATVQGDVMSFEFPEGKFPFVIHAATESSAKLNLETPLLMFDTIVKGTQRVLEFARTHGTRKFLLTSSGAVYGKQPPEMTHIPEEYVGSPDTLDPNSAYGEGKRAAELLCTLYTKQYGI